MTFNKWLLIIAVLVSALHVSQPARAALSDAQKTEQVFLGALQQLNQGNPRAAIPAFLAILAKEPHQVRVRLELARAYFAAQDWSRAREEFFLVLSADLPDPVKQRVLGFIRAIDSRRGFNWDLSLSLVSVGNQRRYDDDTVMIDSGGLKLPFVYDRPLVRETGLRTVGSLNFRKQLGTAQANRANYTLYSSLGFDITKARSRTYDDMTVSLAAGVQSAGRNLTFSLGPRLSRRHVSGSLYEDSSGLQISFERRNILAGAVFGNASFSQVTNHANSDNSGRSAKLGFGFRRAIGGRSLIGLSAQIERKDVPNSSENALISQLTAFGRWDISNGVSVHPSLYVKLKNLKAPSALLPANPDERSIGAKLRIEKADWFLPGGFTPYTELSYERTKSDIAAFSYSEGRAVLGLSRRY